MVSIKYVAESFLFVHLCCQSGASSLHKFEKKCQRLQL